MRLYTAARTKHHPPMATRPPPSSKPLTQRLHLKPGAPLLTVGLPADVEAQLSGVEHTSRAPAEIASVLLFAKNEAELTTRLARAVDKLSADPLIWVCYPKGGSGVETDLNRERLWELLAPSALRPVAQIAITDVWSGLRFRRAGAA
jgi:hypothetical protein